MSRAIRRVTFKSAALLRYTVCYRHMRCRAQAATPTAGGWRRAVSSALDSNATKRPKPAHHQWMERT
jgi:hypothetical protein